MPLALPPGPVAVDPGTQCRGEHADTRLMIRCTHSGVRKMARRPNQHDTNFGLCILQSAYPASWWSRVTNLPPRVATLTPYTADGTNIEIAGSKPPKTQEPDSPQTAAATYTDPMPSGLSERALSSPHPGRGGQLRAASNPGACLSPRDAQQAPPSGAPRVARAAA